MSACEVVDDIGKWVEEEEEKNPSNESERKFRGDKGHAMKQSMLSTFVHVTK